MPKRQRCHRGLRHPVRQAASQPGWARGLLEEWRRYNRGGLIAILRVLRWLIQQVEQNIRELDDQNGSEWSSTEEEI